MYICSIYYAWSMLLLHPKPFSHLHCRNIILSLRQELQANSLALQIYACTNIRHLFAMQASPSHLHTVTRMSHLPWHSDCKASSRQTRKDTATKKMWIYSNGEDTPNRSTHIPYSGSVEASWEAVRKHLQDQGFWSLIQPTWHNVVCAEIMSPSDSSVCQTVSLAFPPPPRTNETAFLLHTWSQNNSNQLEKQPTTQKVLQLLQCWAKTFLVYTVFR